MRKLFPLILVSLLLVAPSAFAGPNLDGTWCVYMEYMTSGNGDSPPIPPDQGTEQYEIEIFMSPGDKLFWGEVTGLAPEPGRFFSGVITGRQIYITHWDSVTNGELRPGGKVMTFVNQAWSADDKTSKTSIGRARRGSCPE